MKQKNNVRYLTQLALLVAVEIVMRLLGLGAVPVGPLNMSFLTVPIAIGAVVLGPGASAVLAAEFGLFSLYDAMSGRSAMTGAFLAISVVHTIILCVGMRLCMGLTTGYLSKALKKVMGDNPFRYLISSISAPLLNTFFFMGYIILVFYKSDYIQNLVALKGAVNPIHFVIVLVGIQGLAEAVVCGLVGTATCKALERVVKN